MGVDIVIRQEKLAHVPVAHCRGFQPTSPAPIFSLPFEEVDPSQKPNFLRNRWVMPLQSLPNTFITNQGQLIEPEVQTDAKYAVDVLIMVDEPTEAQYREWLTNRRRPKTYQLHRWLSKAEYETLRKKEGPKFEKEGTWKEYIFPDTFAFLETCSDCPLHVTDDVSCEARLLGYGILPQLRKAMAALFVDPPYLIHAEMADLGKRFSNIFPPSKNKADEGINQAEEREIFMRTFQDQVNQTGIQIVSGKVPPLEAGVTMPQADAILNKLFFRKKKEPGFWIKGTRLVELRDWLLDLLKALKILKDADLLTEEMRYLQYVCWNYYLTCLMAAEFNLDIGVSW